MKKQHRLMLISLVVLSVICIRAWPRAAGGVLAAAPVEGAAVLTQLSGRVYEGAAGTEPPTSTGIGGVTVRVYGSTKPDTMYGDLLNETTTDADGWYGLDFNEVRYPYYNIVETDPSTHYSVWSSSVDGTRMDNNWIQYEAPIAGSKTTTGNKFWDLPRVSPTPTRTARPTYTSVPPSRTPSPTATRPPVVTPTATLTRPPQTRTPTSTPLPGCEYLTADFDWTTFCALSFTFSDKSTTSPSDPINSWQWTFGDGASSSQQNPAHTYSAPGVYDVTLTVRTRGGCEASVSKQVEVAYPEWLLRKELVSPVGVPVYVGDEVTYRLVVGAVPPHSILDYYFYDLYDSRYFEFVSASPAPDYVKPAYSTSMLVVWEKQGSIPAGAEREYHVTLRVKDVIEPPVQDYQCNQVWALLTFAPNDCGYSVYAPACVEAGPRPSGLTLTKTLLEPASGVAAIGDVVRFQVEVRNLGTTPITDFDVWDTFLDAEYEFVSASPAPTSNTSDGTNHALTWDNLSLPPGAALAILLELRAKMPGVLTNCARTVEWVEINGVFTVLEPVLGAESCASVQVEALEGRHFAIWKRFTMPTNHIANLGDWVGFATEYRNTGTEPAVRVDMFDHIAPASVSPFLPLNFGFVWPFQTGDWAKVTAAFKTQSVASPAVNTAEWTVTWPDGTKETRAAKDYVYIIDGEIGKGLFIDKWLRGPLPSAAISDTVTFHIAITNVTGIDLPVLPLEDTFPAQCLTFSGASIPPDQVLPGKLVWNNIGPLALGDHIQLDVQFHADAVCPAALNCASSSYAIPGAAPQTVADCDPVTIRGEQPRLVLKKQRTSPSPAHVGDLVTWQIVLENHGTAPLATLPLHDGYQSAFLEYQSAVPAPDHIDLINGRLDWPNLGTLHPGQAFTVTLTLLAKAPGVGVLNCGESSYTVGSSTFTPHDCDTVDIVARGPAIGVAKELAWPALGKPLAVGEIAAFTVTVRNTGPFTLTNVGLVDHFDPDCLSFASSGTMPPAIPGPGQLRWTFPVLAPSETHSWQVLFHANNPCNPTLNCVAAMGTGPEGAVVEAEDCAPLNIEEPQPGLRVRKAMVAPSHVPQVGEVIEYELVVKNAGNTTLMTVEVDDSYDPGCLAYVAAIPAPDTVEPAPGHIHWNNVGPLAPGDAAILRVFLRAVSPCAFAINCVEANWLVPGAPGLTVTDCVEVPIRGEPIATPTPTATRPSGATPTATPTRPGDLTPTPTATRPPGELTPTPTGEIGRRSIYLPIVLKYSLAQAGFVDDFNDGMLAGWTPNLGTWTNPGDHMRGEYAPGNAWDMRNVSAANLDYEGTVNLLSGNAVGLVFRSSADGTSSYDVILDAADNVFKISKRAPYQVLASHAMTVQRNHPYRIRVTALGNTIEGYLDGAKLLTVTDSTYSAGQFGVIVFRATATYDDLEAHALP